MAIMLLSLILPMQLSVLIWCYIVLGEKSNFMLIPTLALATIEEGFNFLGFNARLYQTCQGEKLLIKPSKESIKKSKETISKGIQKLKGNNVSAVIDKLNPIIRGIGNYWSPSVAKRTYQYMDHHIWECTFIF